MDNIASEVPPLRWGILGCARITRRGLIPGIKGSRNGVLSALAGRDRRKAESWAAEFAIPHVFDSYQDLVTSDKVDAVYIPLPNELHRHWVMAAADAGKAILCEKPLALDAHDAATLAEYCEKRGVLLMEAFMWRFQPRSLALLEKIRAGEIGKVRLVKSSFSFPIAMDDWRLEPQRGGGALWDVGCYGVSTARYFLGGEPIRVQAQAHFGPTEVDLSLQALLQFPDEGYASIDCSFEQPFRCVYEVVGDRGAITVPDAYLPGDAPVAWRHDADGVRTEWVFDGRNQYSAMVDAFGDSVAEGQLRAPAENGLMQMRVLDAVRNAARTGVTITL